MLYYIRENEYMKRTILFLSVILLATSVFAENTFSVKQGVSYISYDSRKVTPSENTYLAAQTPALFTDYTALSVNLFDMFSINAETQLNKEYQSVDCNVSYTKSLTDNISVFAKSDFRFVNYTNFNDLYADIIAGVKTTNKLGLFDINFAAFAGYVPLNRISVTYPHRTETLNKSNSTVIGLELSVGFNWKNLSVNAYGEMISHQEFWSDVNKIWPTELNNIVGVNITYKFSDNWSIYSNVSHYCLHPEMPWNNSLNFHSNYDSAKTEITIGVGFAF